MPKRKSWYRIKAYSLPRWGLRAEASSSVAVTNPVPALWLMALKNADTAGQMATPTLKKFLGMNPQ